MGDGQFLIERYASHQNSNIEWLPEIPAHWEVARAKAIFRRMSRPVSEKDKIITVFRDGQVTLRENRRISGFTNAIEEQGYQGLRKNDLVFHAMDAFAGAIGVSDSDGKATPEYLAYTAIDKDRVHIPFYGLLLRQMALSGYVLAIGKSVRERSPRFKHTKFVTLELPIPPPEEQEKIADYLDTKTAQIDRKIDLLTQKAKLYSDLKQSLINETVNRGLDKTVSMKDSGIEWIGRIPKHWKTERLKNVAQIKTGSKDTIDNVKDGKYPFFVRSQTVERINSYSFDGEAILTAGDGVGVGKVFHHINGKFDYHQRVYKISHFKGVSGRLLFYYMKNNFYKDALRFNAKSTVDSLRLPMFENFSLVFGSLEEQKTLADYLDNKNIQIDQILEKINIQIITFKELRKTLINDVVTGKIKVVDNDLSSEIH